MDTTCTGKVECKRLITSNANGWSSPGNCSDIRAITILLDQKLEMQAISLIYAAIDRLAWLDAEKEKSGSAEYKNWVGTFLFNGEVFNFNADDLWAARCGNIHTGAAESRDYRADRASVIYYHVNTASISNDKLLALIDPIATHIGVPVKKSVS